MHEAPRPSANLQRWKRHVSPGDDDREETLRRLIADAKACVDEDERDQTKHAAELLEMLARIEMARSEIMFSEHFGTDDVKNAFVRATEVIQKYVETCLKTTLVVTEENPEFTPHKKPRLHAKCGNIFDEKA